MPFPTAGASVHVVAPRSRCFTERVDVDRYLKRIAFHTAPKVDFETLEGLQRAHLTAVPFENLDVYNDEPVRVDADWAYTKVVERGRGGWCFELNGAFATLLEALGFSVVRLGAAVLLGGPTEIVDHLCLEVTLDQPYLVDVGFGDSFIRPLALNQRGPQDGLSGTFEFLASPQGTTMTRRDDDGVPAAQYRFSRVGRQEGDFEAASQALQADKDLSWHRRAFATRLIDGGPDRVTLVGNKLKRWCSAELTETTVVDDDWAQALAEWFGLPAQVNGPPART